MVNSNAVIQTLREDFAPYAAISNVMEVINRKREHGLSAPLNPSVLESISIPKGNASRTLQTLNFLGLIDEDGTQTELFNQLGRAGEANDEYRSILEKIIRHSYRKVFEIVDPAQAADTAINDAFRQFGPETQRARMLTFFLGMCEQAGITQPNSRERRNRTGSSSRSPSQRNRSRSSQPSATIAASNADETSSRRVADADTEYRLVFAVMQQLPSDRQWTADRRQKWLAAVEAAVDLMVDVVEEPRQVPVLMPPRDFQEGDGI